MGHCKACGVEVKRFRINKITGQPEELCNECLVIARLSAIGIDGPINDREEDVLDALDINFGE